MLNQTPKMGKCEWSFNQSSEYLQVMEEKHNNDKYR